MNDKHHSFSLVPPVSLDLVRFLSTIVEGPSLVKAAVCIPAAAFSWFSPAFLVTSFWTKEVFGRSGLCSDGSVKSP